MISRSAKQLISFEKLLIETADVAALSTNVQKITKNNVEHSYRQSKSQLTLFYLVSSSAVRAPILLLLFA